MEWTSRINDYGRETYYAQIGSFQLVILPHKKTKFLLQMGMDWADDGYFFQAFPYDSPEEAMKEAPAKLLGIATAWALEALAALGGTDHNID